MLTLLLSPLYRFLGILGAVLLAIAAIYGKGRGDASKAAKLKNYKETQDAIEKANEARSSADVDFALTGRLRDDGYRRD